MPALIANRCATKRTPRGLIFSLSTGQADAARGSR